MGLPSPNPHLKNVPVYQPGKSAPPGSIKLASNENAHGPSLAVRRALREWRSIERYPDGGGTKIRSTLAGFYRVRSDQIILGAGSDELGDLIARAFLRPGDAVIFPEFTFVRYDMSAQTQGARSVESRVQPDFSVDVSDLCRRIKQVRPRMICLANPNNPTGSYVSKKNLERILRATPRGTVFLLDEAYFEYASGLAPDYPDGISLIRRYPNLIVLRTFSKIYALASLRIGYGIGHPGLISQLHKVRPPFNVNSPAQIAATAALGDPGHVQRCSKLNKIERERIENRMRGMGIIVIPSAGNFLMIRVPGVSGPECFKKLARSGVVVRDLVPYKLLDHVRITVGTRKENDRLLKALKNI